MTEPEFSPGLEGVIATDTELSFLDVEHERIVVRGYDLIELARRVHYADVAFLLIHGDLPGPGRQSMFANATARSRDSAEGSAFAARMARMGSVAAKPANALPSSEFLIFASDSLSTQASASSGS